MDVKPLIAELKARVVEELDYGLEADAQRGFAAAYAGDAEIVVPRVVASAPKVIVSEWLDGTPLSRIIAGGTREQRDRAGHLLAVLHFSGPQRAGLLHADPHPGNFRLLADGRLGVIDFGATARLPDGHPEPIGRLLRWALAGKAEEVLADLRAEGFVRPNVEVDAEGVLDYLRPLLEPVVDRHFHFSRRGCRSRPPGSPIRAARPTGSGRQLNLPPAYLLIHRVTIGSIGVLCQLDAAGRLPRRARGMAARLRRGMHERPGRDAPGASRPGLGRSGAGGFGDRPGPLRLSRRRRWPSRRGGPRVPRDGPPGGRGTADGRGCRPRPGPAVSPSAAGQFVLEHVHGMFLQFSMCVGPPSCGGGADLVSVPHAATTFGDVPGAACAR